MGVQMGAGGYVFDTGRGRWGNVRRRRAVSDGWWLSRDSDESGCLAAWNFPRGISWTATGWRTRSALRGLFDPLNRN